MVCPRCGHNLSQNKHWNIMHCSYCGTNVLEDNVINRISLNEAKELADHSNQPQINNISHLCPYDHTPLSLLQEESVPQFITILKCPICQRIVISGDDLVAFKKAQKAKVNFFKSWQMPLPSLHSVLVYSMLIALGLTTLSMFGTIFTPHTTSTQARDIIKNITISQNNSNTIVYFTSIVPLSSRITFYNRSNNKVLLDSIISNAYSIAHLINITSIKPSADIYYIIYLNNDTLRIQTPPTPFIITK